MKIWCISKSDTAIKWRENAPASLIPSAQGRAGVSELIQTKLEPSLHFESRFSGIQLLVVDEPYLWPVSLITFLGKLLSLQA